MAANLTVQKIGTTNVAPGGTVTYNLLVRNQGDITATGIEIVDTLPTGFTITGITPGGNFTASETSPGVVTFGGGSLAAGGLAFFTINGIAPQGATGSIQNVAVADPNNTIDEGVNENDNADTLITTIDATLGPDLRIFKIDNPDPVAPGDSITYQLVVRNDGPTTATNINVRDSLPTGFTVSQITTDGDFAASQTGNVISFTGGTLASNESALLTIVGTTPTTPGEITNIAVVDPDGNITESDETNNIVTETTTLDTALLPDLTISKIDTPSPVAPGETLTYQLVVNNNGPGDVTNIVVRDTLDANFSVTQITSFGDFSSSQTGNVISFTGGSLSSGESAFLTIVGTVPETPGTISNIAVVDPDNTIPESNDNNNTVTETTSIDLGLGPDLTISKVSNPSSVIPGDTITYGLIVSNNGPGSASNIEVRDSLPSGFTVTQVTPGGDFTATQGSGVVSFTGGSLASGDSAFLTIVGTVPQNVTGDLINTALVDPDGQILENNEGNNSTAFTTTVGLPDLTITKVGSPNFNVTAGDTITYQLIVTNAGQGPATNIVVRDNLPSNFLVSSIISGGNFTSSEASGVVTFSGGSLSTGEFVAMTIVGRLVDAGQITNTAVVDPDNSIAEENDNNNTATFTVAVASPNPVFVDDDWSSLTIGTDVDPDGAGTEFALGDGVFGINAFANINEGVQKVADNGTVRVFAGTYGDLVGITKPVSLIGPNASINPNTQTRNAEATITGASAGIGFLDGASAGQVIIDGFRLEGAGPGAGAAIDTSNGGQNTTIRNNVITGSNNDAIRNFPKSNPLFSDVSNLVIENNLIENISNPNGSSRGMFLQDVNGLTVTGNVVRDITVGDNPGILLDTVTGNVLVQNNTLTNIASQGIQVAGIGSAGGTVTITENVLTNVNAGANGTSGTGNDEDITNAGIRLRNSPFGAALGNGTVSVTNNRIENTMNGLVIRNSADANAVTVSGNFFVNTAANPGGSNSNFSFNNLSPGNYAIINGGINTLNAAGNFEDLLGTDLLDSADVAGSVTI